MVKPDDLQAFYENIENKISSSIESESNQIKNELTNVEGFIDDVPQLRIEIEERLKRIVIRNPKYQDFMQKFTELVESHLYFKVGTSNSNE